ncbi:MAG: hypothetical protein IH610_15225 [Deltaproteobacteria bacterium]|nr:hypothetical protein [Deltaproteobacteria bacterium]
MTSYDNNYYFDPATTILAPGPRAVNIGTLAAGETSTVLIADFEVPRVSGDTDVRVTVNVAGTEPDPTSTNNGSDGSYLIDGENLVRIGSLFNNSSGGCSTTGGTTDDSLGTIFGAYGPLILMAIGLKAYSIVRYRKAGRRV